MLEGNVFQVFSAFPSFRILNCSTDGTTLKFTIDLFNWESWRKWRNKTKKRFPRLRTRGSCNFSLCRENSFRLSFFKMKKGISNSSSSVFKLRKWSCFRIWIGNWNLQQKVLKFSFEIFTDSRKSIRRLSFSVFKVIGKYFSF